jgi:hypothetical protein
MTETQAADDLAFIRKIMDESRSFAEVGGTHFVIWGVTTGLAMLLTWAMVQRLLPGSAMAIYGLWFVALFLATAVSMWFGRREKKAVVRHPVNRQIGAVWFAIGMPMLLLFFVAQPYGLVKSLAIPTTAAALLGSGIYLTGSLAKINWLRNLAIVWWLASIGLMMVRGPTVFLCYAILLFVLYVVPGLKLNQLARRAAQ